ncbi:MAG TPA: hypothetical protein VNQ74_12320 [Burkholderiaceae bacterium]|nr:hypothetical protein [Burkholderiaceae bacterium]
MKTNLRVAAAYRRTQNGFGVDCHSRTFLSLQQRFDFLVDIARSTVPRTTTYVTAHALKTQLTICGGFTQTARAGGNEFFGRCCN